MLNRVILIGRLVRDPDGSYTQKGNPVTKMRIAVDRRGRNPETNERETDFIDLVAWGTQADFARNYLKKGRLIAVEGRLQIRSWNAQDGTRRWSAEVVVDSIQGLDRPKEGVAEEAHDAADTELDVHSQTPAVEEPVEDTLEDDPFAAV